MTIELKTKPFIGGLTLPEGLRWHDGRLWFSDMNNRRVMTVDAEGRTELVASFADDNPSGLGFLADNSLIVAMMWTRQLRRVDARGAVSVYADFAHLRGDRINDIVVDGRQRIYVDNNSRPRERTGMDDARDLGDSLIAVDPDGSSRIAVSGDIIMPNGMAITPDFKTLILAEVFARRLTAFTIAQDGTLNDRRIFAELDEATPDGICLDAEGAVWVSSPHSREVIRVRQGGEVTHRVSLPVWAVCCRLGGSNGTTLFVSAVECPSMQQFQTDAVGRIETVEVEVPGAGW